MFKSAPPSFFHHSNIVFSQLALLLADSLVYPHSGEGIQGNRILTSSWWRGRGICFQTTRIDIRRKPGFFSLVILWNSLVKVWMRIILQLKKLYCGFEFDLRNFLVKLHGREKDRSWKMKGLSVVGNLTVRCWGMLIGLDFDVIWANKKNKNAVEMVHNKENNNSKQKWILWKNLISIKGIHVENINTSERAHWNYKNSNELKN